MNSYTPVLSHFRCCSVVNQTGQIAVLKALETFLLENRGDVGKALPSMELFYLCLTTGSNFDKIIDCTSFVALHWNICPSVHLIKSGEALWRQLPLFSTGNVLPKLGV